MNLAVFGATGATGRHVVEQALLAGHTVRALLRSPDGAKFPDAVGLVAGSVLDAEAVSQTIGGADAVLSCLGVTPTATFTRRNRIVAPGMAHIVEAMRTRGVRRLVAVSTFGAGDSWHRLSLAARLVMGGLLWGELADKNAMEAVIRASGLDWTIVRPVNLKDSPATGRWMVDHPGRLGFGDWIPRGDVAAFMLATPDDPGSIGHAYLVKAGGDGARRLPTSGNCRIARLADRHESEKRAG